MEARRKRRYTCCFDSRKRSGISKYCRGEKSSRNSSIVGAKLRAFDAKTGKQLFEYDNNVSPFPTDNETGGGTTTYKDTLYWSLGNSVNTVPVTNGPSGVAAFRVVKK